MTPSEWTIREAIQSNILAADSISVVWLGFILDVLIGNNANALKPESGTDIGKIHGWMIGDPSEGNKRKTPVRPDDDDSAGNMTNWKVDTTLTYPIWFLHYYNHGNAATGENTHKLFSTIRDAVVTRFTNRPRLAIAGITCGGINQVYKHGEMQAQNRPEIVSMGDEWAHWVAYELTVDLYRTPAG